jgi:hypothetical protein
MWMIVDNHYFLGKCTRKFLTAANVWVTTDAWKLIWFFSKKKLTYEALDAMPIKRTTMHVEAIDITVD